MARWKSPAEGVLQGLIECRPGRPRPADPVVGVEITPADPGAEQVPDLPAGVLGPGRDQRRANQFPMWAPQVSCNQYPRHQSQQEAAIHGGKTPGAAEYRDGTAVSPDCLTSRGLRDRAVPRSGACQPLGA
ncbi:MAG: hypothetical protein JWO49_1189 [Arthrobacter sp.]|nr:hypothetical protein [Arthrobacter sp.]